MKKLCLLFCSVLMLCPSLCFARGVGVGLGLSGTSGVNVWAGYHNPQLESFFLRRLGVRLDMANTEPLKSAIDSVVSRMMRHGVDVGNGVEIDSGEMDAWHTALLVDFYPFAGAWRLTAGYYIGDMSMSSDIYGTVENAPGERFYFYLAGDHYYYNGNNFSGSTHTDWHYNGPYIGTGFDWLLSCGLGVYMDAGVVFTNRPAKMSLDVPQEQLYVYNRETGAWSPVSIPQLDADITRATSAANRKLSDFPFYPMVKVGFYYRF